MRRSELVNPGFGRVPFLMFVAVAISPFSLAYAQKVSVGYNKSADFSRYKSYTIEHPAVDPARPMLYANIVGAVQNELSAKGLVSKDQGGDLSVRLSGGLDWGLGDFSTADSCKSCQAPLLDPLDWTGNMAPPGAGGKGLPKGNLQINFVDPATNKVVWSGSVAQKLDPDQKEKSLAKIGAAVKKLLAEFPPTKK